MAAQIEPVRLWLPMAGCPPGSTRGLLMVMAQFGRWMQAKVADGAQLTVADLDALLPGCDHGPRIACRA